MDPKAVERTVAILERHHDDLVKLPGVVGADVVQAADGQPAIVAYCKTEADLSTFGGVKVLLPSGNRVRFRVAE